MTGAPGTLERAIEIATDAHRGQVDKSGQPYIGHPLRVMAAVSATDEKIVAVLHDVIEDTDITIEQLQLEGFAPSILEAVDAISKREGESLEASMERVASSRLAIRVKVADLDDNSDPSRLNALDGATRQRLVAKYERSRALIALATTGAEGVDG